LPTHNIIVIGGSAGAVEALGDVLHGLPADLPAVVCAVLHRGLREPDLLAAVLSRISKLPISVATHGTQFKPGHVYLAPGGAHLLIGKNKLTVVKGPSVNFHRPAIDPLFRSAAHYHGARVAGVILSGYRDDGAAGLQVIRGRGGVAIVQDPKDAAVPAMPQSVLDRLEADYILPAAKIPGVLVALSRNGRMPRGLKPPRRRGRKLRSEQKPSTFTCPDCGGALWEITEGDVLTYRCRVGHSFTGDNMMAGQDQEVERALWSALRALEERTDLARRLAEQARRTHRAKAADVFRKRAASSQADADALRGLLLPNAAEVEDIAPGNYHKRQS